MRKLQEKLRTLGRQLEEAAGGREGLQAMLSTQLDEATTLKVCLLSAHAMIRCSAQRPSLLHLMVLGSKRRQSSCAVWSSATWHACAEVLCPLLRVRCISQGAASAVGLLPA